MHRVARVEPAALLEREHEVGRIRVALEAVGQNAGGALVIEGAAGVGKSRLLEEARVSVLTPRTRGVLTPQ
jgi:predicted ATPase